MTFATHFLALLGKGKVHANILFGKAREGFADRKVAARVLHQDVVALHGQLRGTKDKDCVQAAERE